MEVDEIENPELSVGGRKHKRKGSISIDYIDQADAVENMLDTLYTSNGAGNHNFPKIPSPETQRECMIDYRKRLDMLCLKHTCACCGRLVEFEDVSTYKLDDEVIEFYLNYFDTEAEKGFDQCAMNEDTVDLCRECYESMKVKDNPHQPKFSRSNHVNETLCQEYPSALCGLTLVEEAMIAMSYVIGILIKIGSEKLAQKNPGYSGSRAHIIAVKQDPTNLLKILPSEDLFSETTLTFTWEGRQQPSEKALRDFCTVDKEKVLKALRWLCTNNPAYKNVLINNNLLNTWPADPFVPQAIRDTMRSSSAHYEDGIERAGYRGPDLEEGTYQNELDAHLGPDVDDGTITSTSFFSDCHGRTGDSKLAFYARLDEIHQELTQELERENAISLEEARQRAESDSDSFQYDRYDENTFFDSTDEENEFRRRVDPDEKHIRKKLKNIKFRAAKGIRPKSSYIDADYFPSAYPLLFPYGSGGHKGDQHGRRPVPVAIRPFAKWCLEHHSRR